MTRIDSLQALYVLRIFNRLDHSRQGEVIAGTNLMAAHQFRNVNRELLSMFEIRLGYIQRSRISSEVCLIFLT